MPYVVTNPCRFAEPSLLICWMSFRAICVSASSQAFASSLCLDHVSSTSGGVPASTRPTCVAAFCGTEGPNSSPELRSSDPSLTQLQVLIELERVKSGANCRAVGQKQIQEIGGVVSLVRGLSEGVGPTEEEVLRFSSFYKSVVKQLEFFHYGDYNQPSPAGKGDKLRFNTKLRIAGRPAILRDWDSHQIASAKGETSTLAQLQTFRTYSWLLTAAQRDEVGKAIHTALRNMQQTQTLKQITDGGSTGADATNSSSRGKAPKQSGLKPGSALAMQSVSGAGAASSASTASGSGSSAGGGEAPKPSIYRFFVGGKASPPDAA